MKSSSLNTFHYIYIACVKYEKNTETGSSTCCPLVNKQILTVRELVTCRG